MAIVTHTTTVSAPGESTARWFYAIKTVLVGVYGWTVAGSGNGSVGAMDAVDRIASHSDLSSQWGWFVLQSPHASPSDRIQLLLTRDSTTSTRGAVWYDPQANLVGGGAASYPTSATLASVVSGSTISESGDVRITFTGDTATHWFALLVTVAGVPTTSKWGLAALPLTNQVAGAGRPYAIYSSIVNQGYGNASLPNSSIATAVSKAVAQWGLGVPSTAPGLRYSSTTATVIPAALQTSEDGEDINFPIIHAITNGRYFGVNAVAMWNGTSRSSLTTLNGLNRIVFDDINLPWDGATQPQA